MHKASKVGTYAVADDRSLSEVIEEAVRQDFEGNLLAAVNKTNDRIGRGNPRRGESESASSLWPELPEPEKLDYATVWRRLAAPKKSRRLKASTVAWLVLLVGHKRRERLLSAVLSPLTQWLIARQDAWERRTFARLAGNGIVLATPATLMAEMLKANPKELCSFYQRMKRHGQVRTNVALMALLAPFLDADRFGSLERQWEEMGGEDRKQYVHYTLQLQALLLKRAPNVQRAQELAASKPGKRSH